MQQQLLEKAFGKTSRYYCLAPSLNNQINIFYFIAAVDCVRTKTKPKKRMAARSAAILFLSNTYIAIPSAVGEGFTDKITLYGQIID
jgi:hypothetical protein